MKTRCIILDDEPLACDILKSFITKLGNFEIVAACPDAMKALQVIRNQKIDLIFMDIQMPHISGFEFLKILKNPPKVIVTTGFSEFALNGFEFNIVDYLLKPFSFERFVKSVEKYYQENEESLSNSYDNFKVQSAAQSIFVKENKRVLKIQFNEILFIEGLGEYVQIYTRQKKIITKTSLASLHEKLPPDDFIRIHKSYIVPVSRIEAFTAVTVEVNGKELPIGRNYKNSVLSALQVYSG